MTNSPVTIIKPCVNFIFYHSSHQQIPLKNTVKSHSINSPLTIIKPLFPLKNPWAPFVSSPSAVPGLPTPPAPVEPRAGPRAVHHLARMPQQVDPNPAGHLRKMLDFPRKNGIYLGKMINMLDFPRKNGGFTWENDKHARFS